MHLGSLAFWASFSNADSASWMSLATKRNLSLPLSFIVSLPLCSMGCIALGMIASKWLVANLII